MRVLVIEDEWAVSNLIKIKLEDDPDTIFEVDCVGTVADGLKALRRERYGVIVLDVCLPNGQGVEVINTIVDAAPDIPCVVITGDRTINKGDVILRGAKDFIYKPFGVSKLIEAISLAVGVKWQKQAFDSVTEKINLAEQEMVKVPDSKEMSG